MAKKKHKKRIKPRSFIVLGLALITISLLFTVIYSTNILPSKISYLNKTITSTKIPATFKDIKIAYFSDLDIKDENDIDRLQSLVNGINDRQADIIVFGGDLFDTTIYEKEKVISILSLLKGPMGKFAVLGENDYSDLTNTITILEDSGFEPLRNVSRPIYSNDSYITFVGLENTGNIDNILDVKYADTFKFAFVHHPDYFADIKNSSIDITVAGHSHGGYIYLPFIGSLSTIEGAKTYYHGTYTENNKQLFVSSGIGMESDKQIRFGTSSDVYIFTLIPE